MTTSSEIQKIWEENCPALGNIKFQRKYQLLENIVGEGSFGTVISAKCRATQELRAVKAIRRVNSVSMLSIELQLLSELGGHFNIVKLFDFYSLNGSVLLVLEHFPHCNGSSVLFHSKKDLSFSLYYLRNLLSALSYLHANNYVHRDIKLSNFLYSPQRNCFRLVDFGLATYNRSNNEYSRLQAAAAMEKYPECSTCNGMSSSCMFCRGKQKRDNYRMVGTPGVRAPELLLGIGLCNPAIDIFSCGIVLLSLLCVKQPFFMPKNEPENIMNLAFLLGSETIENMAEIEGLRVTISEKIPPADYYHLVLCLRYGFDYTNENFQPRTSCDACKNRSFNNSNGVCFCRKDYETDMFLTGENATELWTLYVDLLYRSLEPDRYKRYNADQLLCLIESYDARTKRKQETSSSEDIKF